MMQKKTVAITQSNYIPWKGYFDMINRSDVFVLYDTAQYTKRDWRNRNRIKTQDGLKWLTIPVRVKGQFYQAINETRVSDRDWRYKHWKMIEYNYKRAPFFSEYGPVVEELYLGCDSEFLSDINLRFLKGICQILNIKTEFRYSSEFSLAGDRTERLVNICEALSADKYITGPAAKAYMQEDMFREAKIELEWMDYSRYKEYPQMTDPFDHSVSVVDLILNIGPKAIDYIIGS